MHFLSALLASELVLCRSVTVLALEAALAGEEDDTASIELALCALYLVEIDSIVLVCKLAHKHGGVWDLVGCVPSLELFFSPLICKLLQSFIEHHD